MPRPDEFAEEVRSHIAHETDRLIAAGTSPAEAYARARARFGNVTMHQEEHFASQPMRAGLNRVTILLRRIRRAPVFSGTVVLLLALTFTALTLAGSAVFATRFRRVAAGHATALVNLWTLDPATSGNTQDLVPGDVLALWRGPLRSLTAITASQSRILRATGAVTTTYPATAVDGSFFRTLELRVTLGRGILPSDDVVGAVPVAVLSNAIWRHVFAAKPDVIGKPWHLAGITYTVIGVLPAEANTLAGAALVSDPGHFTATSQEWYSVIGRMAPGKTAAMATADLSVLTARASTMPGGTLQHGALLTSFSDDQQRLSGIATLLIAAVALLSGVALINILTFFLVRALGATRRTAISMALGASARTLLGEAAMEGLLLGTAGGLIAVAGMCWGRVLLQEFVSTTVTGDTSRLPYSVTGAATTVASAAIISAIVALGAHLAVRRINLSRHLHGTGAGTVRTHNHWRAMLVTVQVALAFVAAVTAARLLASVGYTSSVPVGYETDHLVVAQLPVWGTVNGTNEGANHLAAALAATTAATAGLGESAAWATLGFRMPRSAVDYSMVIEGSDQRIGATRCNWDTCPFTIHPVTDNTFRVVGIPLVQGRVFGPVDRAGDPVAIINVQGAKAWFAGSNPIGKRIQLRGADDGERWRTIVGVVGNVNQLNEMARLPRLFRKTPLTPAMIYIPLGQAMLAHAGDGMGFPFFVAVRSRLPVQAAVKSLRAIVTTALPEIERPAVSTMEAVLARGAVEGGARTNALVTSTVALILIVLVIGGIAGTAAESVRSQTREMGIRLALGCSRVGAIRTVVSRIARLIGAGLIAGAAGWQATRGVTQQILFGRVVPNVAPQGFLLRGPDRTAIAVIGSLVAILVVGLAAALIPSIKAARLDPAAVLRTDT
ncbi:MAG TPA: ABC transporter permease [Gemmatimonadales bacterium]|jgi:predicted permease